MAGDSATWVVVLATEAQGTASSRRSAVKSTGGGRRGPLPTSTAKLSRVISRAQLVSGHDRCVVVVPAAQWTQLESVLAQVESENLFLQPCDRGTACSLLWPLVHIAFKEPESTVVVLPAERGDVDTVAFARALNATVDFSRRDPGNLILLAPTAAGTYANGDAEASISVDTDPEVVATNNPRGARKAREVIRSGELWGGLTFAAQVSTLLGIFEWSIPWLVRMFNYWLVDPKPELHSRMVDHLFRVLPEVDFAERVLPSAAHEARVVAVPRCLCSDLEAGGVTPRCRLSHDGCGLAATKISAPTALPAAVPSVASLEPPRRSPAH